MAKKSASKRSTAKASPGTAGREAGSEAPRRGGAARGKAKSSAAPAGRKGRTFSYSAGSAKGKHLVIVESPSKAKTINKYLGPDYLVLASIGHVRDLPSKNPKGVKSPVPGVDLDKKFKPTYETLPGKEKVVSELKRAARESLASGMEVWFATDLDREGEAIAWHLAQELGIASAKAKRVIFAAITKREIEKAFQNPHPIDEDRVNAQQARRILDRIVGYQVSPLLWKKVARGLSAGRVQSVAVRLVVEREREIRAFIPEEFWRIEANFATQLAKAVNLGPAWAKLLAQRDAKGNPPTLKVQNAWLSEHGGIQAELVEVAGDKFEVRAAGGAKPTDLTPRIVEVAKLAGMTGIKTGVEEDAGGKGPARFRRRVEGAVDPATPYEVVSLETRRTTTRPTAPFITSTLQQAGSTRLGFAARRTMRTAQQLYEGIDIPGEGPVGLITYMRTDSTHVSAEAIDMARAYIKKQFGDKYLPEKPNFYSSSNKAAQEAHEAIRPTSLEYPPSKVRGALNADQLKLYTLIWERFVACQMTPAQWDLTTAMIRGGTDKARPVTFKATGRVLVFDGFYKVTGVPSGDEQNLPMLAERQRMHPFALDASQRFTSPPPRYTEASLIKMLESEGIGRPSTYAEIIQKIQDRKYVELLERRFHSTDLGEVVTDKLIEAFPQIMDVGYTREMEAELDKVEEDHIDWIEMLNRFYGPFTQSLERAHEELKHAKAETVPAPKEYRCAECGSDMVYRFGRSGRFLSCARYPDCSYASPVDREGKPRAAAETVDVACPKCGSGMTRRTGRFGPFLGCSKYGAKEDPCDGILNIDKKGHVVAPSQPPLLTDEPCPKCESPMNLRPGKYGPWLGCSRFPKCRGRGKFTELPDDKRKALEAALAKHEKANPIAIIRTMSGKALTDAKGKPLADAPTVDVLAGGDVDATGEEAELESVA